MEYTAGFFYNFLSEIDESKWTIGALTIGNKHCALGHVREKFNDYTQNLFCSLFNSIGSCVTSINDGADRGYRQITPKERVLSALMDIKQNEALKEAKEIINEEIKTPSCV